MNSIEGDGPYILWQNYGYDGWGGTRFRTLAEAMKADRRQVEWLITKEVSWEAVESEGERR